MIKREGMVIGGTFDNGKGKFSKIVEKLWEALDWDWHNSGNISELKALANLDAEPTIWMPNIDNCVDKVYPIKQRGQVLICSKVLRENRTEYDAVARIFQMHANAVIAIDISSNVFKFSLIDALGNVWIKTSSISLLAATIKSFLHWNRRIKREPSVLYHQYNQHTAGMVGIGKGLAGLVKINKRLSKIVQNQSGNRFFGNLSTRCMKLFPSARHRGSSGMLVSGRNVSKEFITEDDFVHAWLEKEGIHFSTFFKGPDKPSVDSPIQARIYSATPNINYMIHGHAFIEGADETRVYHACGDVVEAEEVMRLVSSARNVFAVNLKSHGFLIGARTIELLNRLVSERTFKAKTIGP